MQSVHSSTPLLSILTVAFDTESSSVCDRRRSFLKYGIRNTEYRRHLRLALSSLFGFAILSSRSVNQKSCDSLTDSRSQQPNKTHSANSTPKCVACVWLKFHLVFRKYIQNRNAAFAHGEDRRLKCLIWFTPARQNIYFSTLIVVFITFGAIEEEKGNALVCVCVLLYHKYVYSGQLRRSSFNSGWMKRRTEQRLAQRY